MVLKIPSRRPQIPVFLARLSTDEYSPPPESPTVRRAVARVRAEGPEYAARLSMSLTDYWSGRRGTAAALRAVDEAWGGGFYNLPKEAELDKDAADAALGGDHLVIDVQVHYVSDRPGAHKRTTQSIDVASSVAHDRFQGLSKLVWNQRALGFSFAEFLRCVFLETENDMAVLSAGSGAEGIDDLINLNNAEKMGTRELIDSLAGTGRLLIHSNIHPNVPGELEMMDRWREWCNPAGWKIYTMYGASGAGNAHKPEYPAWNLGDEEYGRPFLQSVMKSGARMVSAHKGISVGSDPGWDGPSSPRDIGPAAKAFPEINFLVYHSGYEPREGDEDQEGPYTEETQNNGTNRLIKSLKDAGIGPGGNVYAELGSTWYLIMAHPQEAAHVMGKLLSALGEDNILWGTDSCFYGPAQPMLDAFRAFQIPEEYCQKYGYPQLTATAKEKILGLNAARLYSLDPEEVRRRGRSDDLAWVRAALAEYKAKGTPTHV